MRNLRMYMSMEAEISFKGDDPVTEEPVEYLLTISYDYELWRDYFRGEEAELYGWVITCPSFINGVQLTEREIELLNSQLTPRQRDLIADFVDSLIP